MIIPGYHYGYRRYSPLGFLLESSSLGLLTSSGSQGLISRLHHYFPRFTHVCSIYFTCYLVLFSSSFLFVLRLMNTLHSLLRVSLQ